MQFHDTTLDSIHLLLDFQKLKEHLVLKILIKSEYYKCMVLILLPLLVVFLKTNGLFIFFISYFRTENRNADCPYMINQRQRKDVKMGTNLTKKQPSVPA